MCTSRTNKNIHLHQYSCPSASLDYIIEPWFLGGGASGPGGPEFKEWADASTSKYGTVFGTSIGDLPDPKQPRCALISGRTADNPKLFTECIDAKCKTIILEKPGASTVKELQGMKDEAEKAGVGVLMGYNKVRYYIIACLFICFVKCDLCFFMCGVACYTIQTYL